MKKYLLLFFAGIAIFAAGCGSSYYGIIKEGNQSDKLSQYKIINVGWLDLNEAKWKEFGYESKDKWVTAINFMNQKNMPQYLKEAMEGKKVTVVASKKEIPAKNGLVVKFSEVEYMMQTSTAAKIMFGAMAGSDTLDLNIHFIDGKTSKELYQVRASIYSKAAMDISGWGFEGRVNNCVYNLAQFIAEKTQ